MCACWKPGYPSFYQSFSLLFSPSQSCRCSWAEDGSDGVFLEVFFFGGDQHLIANWLQPVSNENGFLNSASKAIWEQRRWHTPLQPWNIQENVSDGLEEMDQEGQDQERNKRKNTLCDLSTFTSLIKTNFPSISKSERSLLEMTSPRTSPVDNLMHY